ncbi:MAG TPA: ATP-binding protein [Spirochaetia bacterium]|nr:ATP-binding protein [Spirochaetia bacterium]
MKERNLYLLVPFFLLQALTIIAITGKMFATVSSYAQTSLWFLNFMGLADVIIVLVVARKWSAARQLHELPVEDSQDASDRESLLLAAKAQRHDFLNHLNVISGLLNLNMTGEAKAYINQFCADVRDVSDLLTLGKPVVGSLILNKVSLARARGIDFKLTVKTDLTGLKVKETYITKVLGNLIDNAMEALQTAQKKEIELIIDEKDNYYVFELIDSGTTLNEALTSRIFQPLFSTKGPDRGIGLAIARHIAEICGGEIEVKLFPTTFTVRFGKQP